MRLRDTVSFWLLAAALGLGLSVRAEEKPAGSVDTNQGTPFQPGSINWDGPKNPFANLPPMPQPAPKYRWEHIEHESLALVGPWGIVWRFNFGSSVTKPYFDPLQTADGRSLTWVAPADHPWHYGLWFSWKYINQVNYWEEGAKVSRPGTTTIVEASVRRHDASGASIHLRLAYHPAGKPNQIAMEDTVDLTVGMPGEDGSYRIIWDQVSSAKHQVLLDRTPPPGQPNGKSWGGYGGLSFRASRFLAGATITESNGKTDMAGHREKADWASLSGRLDGRTAAVTLFDHPTNPRYPTPWFLVMQEKMPDQNDAPFWYMNAAILNDAPSELTQKSPLHLRYMVRIDSGAPSVAVLDEEFRWFASSQPSTPAISR